MERCLILHGTKLCQLLASRSVCKWRVQPCDSDLKERFLSFVCLFIYFFCHPHFSFFFFFLLFLLSEFFSIRIFPSAFSHPHPPSAGIRSAFYSHPRKAGLPTCRDGRLLKPTPRLTVKAEKQRKFSTHVNSRWPSRGECLCGTPVRKAGAWLSSILHLSRTSLKRPWRLWRIVLNAPLLFPSPSPLTLLDASYAG